MIGVTTIISLWLFVLPLSDLYNSHDTAYFDVDERAHNYTILEEIYSEVESYKTRDFLSSFSSAFERITIYQQLLACPFTPLCEYKLSVPFTPSKSSKVPCCMSCTCDFPKCFLEQSCCLDTLYRKTNVSKTQQHDREPTKKCVKMNLEGSNSLNVPLGVIMTASCPSNTSRQLQSNCTRTYSNHLSEMKDFTPVFDEETFDLYRNAYCAYCHNVSEKHLDQANLKITCDKTVQFNSEHDIIKSVMVKKQCNITFGLPPFIPLEQCISTVSQCNETGMWLDYDPELQHACSMYKATIRIENVLYQNIFCALCNGIKYMNKTECDSPMSSVGVAFSFTGLLKLGTYLKHESKSPENNKCSRDQLFDSVHDTCRDLFCAPHKTLQEGQCSDIFTSIEQNVYSVFLRVVPLDITTVLEANFLADYLMDYVKDLYWMGGNVYCMQMIYKIDADVSAMNAGDVLNSALKFFVVRIEIYMNKDHDPNQFVETVLNLNRLDIGIIYYQGPSKHMKKFDGQLQLVDQYSELFYLISNLTMLEEFNDLDQPECYKIPLVSVLKRFAVSGDPSGAQIPHLRGRDNLARCDISDLGVNILRMKACPVVKLSNNDKPWVRSDNGIRFVRGDYNLNNSEFYFEDNDTVVVCSNVYEKYMAFQDYDSNILGMSIETIVSIVCSSLSILCLSITFLAFCMLSKLREKLPGINNTCLAFVLLCAQFVYLVTGVGTFDVGSKVCTAFGIVLHIVWLLSMFWMNVCTYHMFHVFTRTTTVSKDLKMCRFVIYLFYAISMSCIPVTVNIYMSLSTSDSYGYGDVVCYINSQKMVTYTFGVPTAFVIITNLCMFVRVMVKITMTSMVKTTVNYERNNLIIFAKLSTITGITWIFGFIFSWTDIAFFSYLFIFLNAGQGVFIMFAFIFNTRVLSMLKSDILRQNITSSEDNVKTFRHNNSHGRSAETTRL